MFYGEGSEKPVYLLRKMICSSTKEEREKALAELFPYMKEDIKKTLEAMDGMPVVIRLLDPPLHEFVPKDEEKLKKLAQDLGITLEELKKRTEVLHEANPMMGHRGVRLGVTYPEITRTQVKAIFTASAELIKEGKNPYPEIMIPVVSDVKELKIQKKIVDEVLNEVLKEYNLKKIKYMFGTMMEVPRASFVADELAEIAEFFSFGTNDLTQMGFGFSRDDIGSFLPSYLNQGILADDPFQTIDPKGIMELMRIGIERGRKVRKDLEVGICGEHGGEPRSIEICHKLKLDYVSCSPFRVPIARLSAAQAVIKEKNKK